MAMSAAQDLVSGEGVEALHDEFEGVNNIAHRHDDGMRVVVSDKIPHGKDILNDALQLDGIWQIALDNRSRIG
jgi:hypothetical protein